MTADSSPSPALDSQHFSGQRSHWGLAANAILGVWIAITALTFGDHAALQRNDMICGTLIVILSGLACLPRFTGATWAVGMIGILLMTAPLLLPGATAAAYDRDTFAGALIIAFALLVPGMPGTRDLPGSSIPPGWTHNPSAWPERAPIIALAFIQFLIARYLAAYQLGYIATVWDPFFGNGTRRVLESDVAKAFPISDAGLGAISYLVEALTGFLGSDRRWRSAPWAVLLFGVMIVPVAIVSIVLVVMQPIVVGAWCGLCLVTASITVLMISPAVDEVIATWQFLMGARREGQSFWRVLWRGGSLQSSAGPAPPNRSLLKALAAGMELTSIPWNLIVCAVLGSWLTAAPAVLGSKGAAAANDQLSGALVTTFAVIGFGDAARTVRPINIAVGAWLLLSPWLLASTSSFGQWNSVAIGAAVVLLSVRRGRIEEKFGGWDQFIV